MSTHGQEALLAAALGIGATLIMDGWNLFLKRAFGIASLSYCLLGRWVLHMPEGTFRHLSIRTAARKPWECSFGWLAHYTIGVAFAITFVALTSAEWLARPTPLGPVVFGLVTVAAPFLLMQPSLGLGIASSRAPHPSRARAKSLATHFVFGVGLYLSALAVRWFLQVGS